MTLGDFSEQADAYRRSRPGYPEALLDQLIAEAGVRAGDKVVDFGAGTGIFTEMLVRRRFDVTAVDPGEGMMRQADLPEVRWIQGTFAENPLPAQSQDWAVAAQAFHWAEPAKDLPRIRRILKPGAVFTAIWNNRAKDEGEILAWTEDAIGRHVPEFDEAYRNRDWASVLESTGDFVSLSHRVVPHTVAMSKQRYLELWRSHNRLNNTAGPERFAAFFDELRRFLEQRRIEQVDVPYRCEAWSARRND